MSTTDQWQPPVQQDWRAAPQQQLPQQVMYVKSGGNGLAITGFVTALLGFLCGFVPLIGFLGAFFWGIFGAIFSFLGINKAKKVPHAGHRGLAIAGVVFAVLAFIMGFVNVAATDAAVKEVDKEITKLDAELDKAGQQIESDLNNLDRQLSESNAQWQRYQECNSKLPSITSKNYAAASKACTAILED